MKKWLRSGVLIFIIIMASLMMYLPYAELKRNALEDLYDKQELIARQTVLSIESFFSEQRKMLRHFAGHPIFIHMSDEVSRSIEREYNESSDYIRAITVYDNTGTIRYSYPDPERAVGKNLAAQAHVKKLLNTHKANISDVFMAVQGYETVAISEPIFDGSEFVGVVAFLIDFKFIARNFLENIRIGDSGYAWMISRDGTELYCPVPDHTGVSVMETSKEFPDVIRMAETMMSGQEGRTTYTYDMVKGEETEVITKHAVFVPIQLEDTFWSVVIATPESDVHADLASFFREMMLAVILLIGAVVTLGIISANDYNLSRRNRELERMVEVEVLKRQQHEKNMMQQARFYSMTETLNAIAHQWRQPLNSVGLCIQDIEEAYDTGELDKMYLADNVSKAMESLTALSGTIDDFRNFFCESESVEELNLHDALYHIYRIVRVQYDAKGINFHFIVEGEHADHASVGGYERFNASTYPDMLKQTLLNCLQNAREAVESQLAAGRIEKGHILLKLDKLDDMFVIQIMDNGGGVRPDVLDKVFDPYFTTKDISIGMGMGMYITKLIVEDSLKGSITIENSGEGALVTIKFRSA